MLERCVDRVERTGVVRREAERLRKAFVGVAHDRVVVSPCVVAEERHCVPEATHGELVCRRITGLRSRAQIELGEPLALLLIRDQRGRLIQMIDDVEEAALELAAGALVEEHAADGEVQRRLVGGGQPGVGRLLHAIVQKREAGVDERRLEPFIVEVSSPDIGTIKPVLQSGAQVRRRLGGRAMLDAREQREVESIADRSRDAQHVARGARQLLDLRREQFGDVLRDRGVLDRSDVVAKRASFGSKKMSFERVQRMEELPHEERVAPGLLRNDLGEWSCGRNVLMQRIGDEFGNLRRAERLQITDWI